MTNKPNKKWVGIRKTWMILPIMILLAGCVSVNKSVLDRSFAQRPVAPENVRVFFADDPLPDHIRVAILRASGDSGFTNEGQMIDALRKEAGKLGANAIVLDELREPGTGERVMNALLGGWGTGQRRGGAIAIYVTERDAGDR
jgi:hypothetical protein